MDSDRGGPNVADGEGRTVGDPFSSRTHSSSGTAGRASNNMTIWLRKPMS
jgi:hypothetical protein